MLMLTKFETFFFDNFIGRIELSDDWRYDKDNIEATKLFESARLEKCLENLERVGEKKEPNNV